MSMKKTLAGIASYALVGAVAFGVAGTLAYEKDQTATATNVETLGNVKIQQIEQQRVDDTANQNKLEPFEQKQALRPSYYKGDSIPWAAAAEWVTPNDQAWKVVEDTDNVIDKFITVKNTGKDSAYVRTILAVEVGKDNVNEDFMHIILNGNNVTDKTTWNYEWVMNGNDEACVQIGDGYYQLCVLTYGGLLEPGETTIPSLKQIYMDKTAENKDIAVYGDTFEILAISQAVQSDMDDLTGAEALDEAFGKITATNHPWTEATFVDSAEDLSAALAKGGEAILMEDVVVNSTMVIDAKTTSTLNLNGCDLSYAVDNDGKASAIINNAGTLDITGEGTISFVAADPDLKDIPSYATNTISNTGTLTIGEGVTVINESDGGASYAVDNHGTFYLNGGTLTAKRCALRVAKYNKDGVYFEMNSGTITGSTPAWIQLPGSANSVAPKIDVVINDGVMQTTKTSSADNDVLYTYSYGNSHANTSITINGGEFLGGTVSVGAGYKGDVPTLKINGGTFDYDVMQWLENDTSKVLYTANNATTTD